MIKDVSRDHTLDMPGDNITPIYAFDKYYKITIPDRIDWETGPPLNGDSVWYKDGSKMDIGAGAGIYGGRPRGQLSISLVKFAAVFQAETVAIIRCAKNLLDIGTTNKRVVIFSDSQAALKALEAEQISS
ncbi:hypothetical protein O3M35_010878 [Rhynocoris fuscipes]|uniref:RNase H type-1 domain-containing protein n=1 Tax=Rhynocoris fuscipes TaxID=488301 RepID=A0AAW1D8A6_9HEMI